MAALGTFGKYEIRRQIGRGAMGVVYEAFDPVIERRVAIKTLRLELFEPNQLTDLRARFKREAQAAGRLAHPHIVTIHDYGEHEGTPYIVMEFMTGQELREVLDRGTRLPLSEVVRIMTQLLGALTHAHEHGLVHRDVKPGNVFVLDDGSIKVVDFGIARVEASNLTGEGAMLGTPAYMSPEQIVGVPVDERSDIFSAGVILYELLTGDKPFAGKTATNIMQKVLRQEPLEPSSLNPTLSEAWDAVVKRAMAKKPDERYRSARQFSETVKQVYEGGALKVSGDAKFRDEDPGKKAAQEKAKREAEERARVEAERKARLEVEEERKREADQRARKEPEESEQLALGYAHLNGNGGVARDYAEAMRCFRLAVERGSARAALEIGRMYGLGLGVSKDEAEEVRWYREAADRGNAIAQFSLGMMYANGKGGLAKDDKEAVHWFRKAADQGNATAQNSLGIMYRDGRGVDRDDREAVRWYRKAADQGDAFAQNNLGVAYELGEGGLPKSSDEAIAWYKKAAAQNDATAMENLKRLSEKVGAEERAHKKTEIEGRDNKEGVTAQLALGYSYLNGSGGVTKNYAEAMRNFRLAAEAGSVPAVYEIGTMYANGLGVNKDDSEAVRWFRKAADQGNADAQNYLGFMYEHGRGVLAKDDAEAARWYRKAADQGNAYAQNNLGIMYENGKGGLAKDDSEAVRWYRKSADQGSTTGQCNLAFMYENGRGGLAKDDTEAMRWYRKAADQGHPIGQFSVALAYANGKGSLPRDEAEAAGWYRKAADQGNANAQNNLGLMYELGQGGLPKNNDEAVAWYKKAVTQNNATAIANLKRLSEKVEAEEQARREEADERVKKEAESKANAAIDTHAKKEEGERSSKAPVATPINLDFNALPLSLRQRFISVLTSPNPAEAPILVAQLSTFKSLFRSGCYAFFGAYIAWAFFDSGFGTLGAAHAWQGPTAIIGYGLGIAALVYGCLGIPGYLQLGKSLPFPPGRYLFAWDFVDARTSTLKLFSLAKLKNLQAVHHHSYFFYTYTDLTFTFEGAPTQKVICRDKAVAESTLNLLRQRQAEMRQAIQNSDNQTLVRLDPFFDVRTADWRLGPPEPESSPYTARELPRIFRWPVLVALAAGLVIGVPLWAGRNLLSDINQYRQATRLNLERTYLQYLAGGQFYRDEVNAILPRVAFNEAQRAASVTRLKSVLQRYPAAGLEQDVAREIKLLYAAALKRFRDQAASSDPALGPFMERVLAALETSRNSALQVQFTRPTPDELVKADKNLEALAKARGKQMAPAARHFGSDSAAPREQRIVSELARGFKAIFPSDVLEVKSQYAESGRQPSIQIAYQIASSGTVYSNRESERLFVGVVVRFDVGLALPGESAGWRFKLEVRPPESFTVTTQTPRGALKGVAPDEQVYVVMAERAFDQLGFKIRSAFFRPDSEAFKRAAGK